MSGINGNVSHSGSTGQTSPQATPASTPKAPTTQTPGAAPAPMATDVTQIQNSSYATVSLEPSAPTLAQQRHDAIKEQIRAEIAKLPDAKNTAEVQAIQERVDDLKRRLPDAEWNSLNPSAPKPAFDPAELSWDDGAVIAMITAETAKAADAKTAAEVQAIQERVAHLQRLLDVTPEK